ncbi:hypothetical protein [Aquimarina sp. AU58]|uniref:hypothetical protein n=1 Tax=Aquimarina sp. AU58 TaxID=1874112 RepID=UPI00135BFCA3|nr:hypothetical protein [Aquimarina sp. AU58]
MKSKLLNLGNQLSKHQQQYIKGGGPMFCDNNGNCPSRYVCCDWLYCKFYC